MRNFFFLFVVIMLVLPASSSWAQFSDGVETTTPTFGEHNPALKRLLTLQNQNQLLRKLIERETSVNQMVEAAINVGVSSPFIPAPDHAICQSVPGNITCAKAYESLYPGFMTAAKAPPVAMPSAAATMDSASIPALDAKEISPLPATETAAAQGQIYWMDITCLGKKCSALVSTNPTDVKAHYRILAGEKLPDGSIVRAISAAGVTLERDKKSIELEPAPLAQKAA